MIKSFKCKATEALFRGYEPTRHLRAISNVARRKLDMIDYASRLSDLRAPPGNRLEALKGDRQGQHSIRINDQWRICFIWREDGPHEVEIVDYH
jgi:proteic killer suppression protein